MHGASRNAWEVEWSGELLVGVSLLVILVLTYRFASIRSPDSARLQLDFILEEPGRVDDGADFGWNPSGFGFVLVHLDSGAWLHSISPLILACCVFDTSDSGPMDSFLNSSLKNDERYCDCAQV